MINKICSSTQTVLSALAASVTLAWTASIAAAASLQPPQIESDRFSEVAALVQSEADKGARVLFVTDLDNTILAADQDISSEHWFLWQKEMIANKDPRAVATDLKQLLNVQGMMMTVSQMHPTEVELPQTIQHFSEQGIGTMVLTSRNLDVRDITLRELNRNHFDFSVTAPGPRGGYAGSWLPSAQALPVIYESGVMLTQGQNKGEMLAALLTKTGAHYDSIVFTDDRPHHLENMRRAFEQRPETVYTILFRHEAAKIEAFKASSKIKESAAWCAFAVGWKTLALPDASPAELPFLPCPAGTTASTN